MRKHNFLKAVALTLCMALFASGTAFAATPGQALDAKEVKYGKISKADQNILKSMFNAEEYAAMNEDVVKAVGKDANKLFAHFIKYGVFEGRGPSKSFNVSAYMSSYGDLQKAFGNDIMAYYRHYNNYGKNEKRDLITVEKAEAAGVIIKSVTGATKTVLTPSQENPGAGSSSSTPAVDTSIHLSTTRIYFTEGGSVTDLDVSVVNLPAYTDISGADHYTWTVDSNDTSVADATHSSGSLVTVTCTATGLSTPANASISVSVDAEDSSNAVIENVFTGTIDVIVFPAAADGTAPTLSNGSVSRTSDTAATISFTSDEAGSYFIEVVAEGAEAPTINTTGTGATMQAGANTGIAVTLSAGAQDIYVIAKDAAGNVSTAIKIAAGAYVAPDTTAPTLSGESAQRTAEDEATLKFTSDEAGTYYYLVLAATEEAPNAATVKAQGDAVAKGTNTATASTEVTVSITGLTASTAYKAYVVVTDAANNNSGVSTVDISSTVVTSP